MGHPDLPCKSKQVNVYLVVMHYGSNKISKSQTLDAEIKCVPLCNKISVLLALIDVEWGE
jgi:hypothetical protein